TADAGGPGPRFEASRAPMRSLVPPHQEPGVSATSTRTATSPYWVTLIALPARLSRIFAGATAWARRRIGRSSWSAHPRIGGDWGSLHDVLDHIPRADE